MLNVADRAVACPSWNDFSLDPLKTDYSVQLPWFALQIRQRNRECIEQMLAGHTYEYFSPCTSIEKQWSDRRKTFHVPLFPGYIFCRFDPQQRLPLLKIPGVIGVVCMGRQLQEVNPYELEAIRIALSSRLPVQSIPYLVPGERVLIVAGPLAGVEGVLERIKNHTRIVLLVTTLNRSISVELASDQVASIPVPQSI